MAGKRQVGPNGKGQIGTGGKAIVQGASDTCCCTYKLTPCEEGSDPVYTRENLADYVGRVREWAGECWTVSQEAGTPITDTTTTGNYEDCDACPETPTVYKLTPCDGGSVIYTDVNLFLYLGSVVRLQSDFLCYTVSEDTGTPVVFVAIDDPFASCAACEADEDTASSDPCSDCGGATNVPVGSDSCDCNVTLTYFGYITGPGFCEWSYTCDGGFFSVRYITSTHSITCSTPNDFTFVAGRYYAGFSSEYDKWEHAPGIRCNSSGELEGSHTFGTTWCGGTPTNSCEQTETPTFTF